MMLALGVFTVACAVTLTFAVSINEDGYYDTRYNHLDIERILNNKRLVTYYAQCLTGDGPCTPQGTEFKRILPEALRMNCARCTEKQKVTAYLAIRRLKKEYPKIWQQLQAAWDPTGELVSTFINTVDSARAPGATQVILSSRISGDASADNEITAEAPVTIPLQPVSPSTTTTTSTTTKISVPVVTSSSVSPIEIETTIKSTVNPVPKTESTTSKIIQEDLYYPTTNRIVPQLIDTNYRISTRPNRFNLLLPRPQDIGKLTRNWIGSIGDIGTKVIKTGARIADMVLSGVQAGVHATIRRTLP